MTQLCPGKDVRALGARKYIFPWFLMYHQCNIQFVISFRKQIIIYQIIFSDVHEIWLENTYYNYYFVWMLFSRSELIRYVLQAIVETFCEYYFSPKITLK